MIGAAQAFVTRVRWPPLKGPHYGAPDSYRLAADWLKPCATVADWGGSTGYFGTCLPATTRYTVVDGTVQRPGTVLSNLETYREPSDGILLRHVLDNTWDWQAILRNALVACRHRLVVVTFTPDALETSVIRVKHGWPIRHFAVADLIEALTPGLVRHFALQTSHPEHLYCWERPA
jgi:hypothetical protein